MEGVIVHFRQNRHTQSPNHMIVRPSGVEKRIEAEKLVGKTVSYNTGKNTITGKVASAHGNKGAVRVIFEKGMPGQAIGQKVALS